MMNFNDFMNGLFESNKGGYFAIISKMEEYGFDYNATLGKGDVVAEPTRGVVDNCPPIVKDFDKDTYIAWARYLGVYMEEYGKVRKKDRQTVYDHMYGKVAR